MRQQLPALQIPDEILDSLSLKHSISQDMKPTLILYGVLDQPFVTEPSDAIYYDLIRLDIPCKKIIYENVGHLWMDNSGNYSIETGNRAMDELIKWFDKHL